MGHICALPLSGSDIRFWEQLGRNRNRISGTSLLAALLCDAPCINASQTYFMSTEYNVYRSLHVARQRLTLTDKTVPDVVDI